MRAQIKISLKKDVLDPQGRAIKKALHQLGFSEISEVRQGKYFEVDIDDSLELMASKVVERMCQQLLANPVVETYSYELVD
ncbi:MAG: phosphoribosylformylglycinamidine synthase subunit PurS [Hyphomicrobiaceae bacterium]|nr:phosphoribosylformylglycinamidine synthase subunit PurS [Hyphomicrobiaceae bacterium]